MHPLGPVFVGKRSRDLAPRQRSQRRAGDGGASPFLWFVKNGDAVVDYFSSHQEVAEPWTHNIDCACGTCEL